MMLPGSQEQPGSSFAVQGYPSIVYQGRNVANPDVDAQHVGRAAIIALSDGRVAFAIDTTGMHAFGRSLLALRMANGAYVTDAVYSDGGGSTALALRENGRDVVARGMNARRLPAYVLAIPPSGSPVLGAIAGLGVGGLVAWLALRGR